MQNPKYTYWALLMVMSKVSDYLIQIPSYPLAGLKELAKREDKDYVRVEPDLKALVKKINEKIIPAVCGEKSHESISNPAS